jgi:hypothetical protein
VQFKLFKRLDTPVTGILGKHNDCLAIYGEYLHGGLRCHILIAPQQIRPTTSQAMWPQVWVKEVLQASVTRVSKLEASLGLFGSSTMRLGPHPLKASPGPLIIAPARHLVYRGGLSCWWGFKQKHAIVTCHSFMAVCKCKSSYEVGWKRLSVVDRVNVRSICILHLFLRRSWTFTSLGSI